MKRLKLMATIIVAFLCFNFVSGVNPVKGKNDNLSDLVIDKLNKDVQLTDSQKIILKEKFKAFVVKMEDADKKTNEKDKFETKRLASDEYEAILDSILNTQQKEQLSVKVTQREKNIK